MGKERSKFGLKNKIVYISVSWILLFSFVSSCAVVIQLWGSGVPIIQYPKFLLGALFSIPVFSAFAFIWVVFLVLVSLSHHSEVKVAKRVESEE